MSSLMCWYSQPSIWAGKHWIKHKETCAGTMKTLDLKFLLSLQWLAWSRRQCGCKQDCGGRAWHPALPGLPGTAETLRGWSPVPGAGARGSPAACATGWVTALRNACPHLRVWLHWLSQQPFSGVWAGPRQPLCGHSILYPCDSFVTSDWHLQGYFHSVMNRAVV